MSVLIKGMEMPRNCFQCPLDKKRVWKPEQRPFILCRYTKKSVPYEDVPTDHRLPCCELVEVPTPHGRLIDADELEKKINMLRIKAMTEKEDTNPYWNCLDEICQTPTVIEAEEG